MTHKTKLFNIATIIGGGFGFATGLGIWRNDEQVYRKVIMPILHSFNAEVMHNLTIKCLRTGLFRQNALKEFPRLSMTVFDIEFSNPIGMAAGFDKQAEVYLQLAELGFGFVEVGTVTPVFQEGNEKPRVFRLPEDGAVINRYGFNSVGHDAVYERLSNRKPGTIVGVNLGKNKESDDEIGDYVSGMRKFTDVCNYLVVNISSPNTVNLRSLQKKEKFCELLLAINEAQDRMARKVPLLIKLSPDLSLKDMLDIASIIKLGKCRIDGLIISNTTVNRPPGLLSSFKEESGGLSGEPLKNMSTECIRTMYRMTKGCIPIIGVGGISSGSDAFDKICAGASLLQLYTALTYHGPTLIDTIKRDLDQLLQDNNYKNISEAIGSKAYE